MCHGWNVVEGGVGGSTGGEGTCSGSAAIGGGAELPSTRLRDGLLSLRS